MILYQKFHFNKIYRHFRTELWQFELGIWIHVFGRSMISIFIPIFMLTAGYSISKVMLFYFVFNIFDAPLNFLAQNLTYKLGAKKVIMLGSVSYIIFFLLLYNLTYGNWFLLIALALLMAIYDTFYWVAHLYFFMNCSLNDDNVSKDTSVLYIIKKIAGFIAPLIGAVVLIFFSEKVLIAISVVILLLSLWPLYRIKNIKDRPKKKPLKIAEFFQSGKELKEYIVLGLQSFHSVAESVIWPIFIFTLFNSFESVAIIPIITSISTVIFTFFVGRVKKRDRDKTIALGALLIALVWILRMSVDYEIFYYISVFLVGVFSVFIMLPIDSMVFENGEKKNALNASTYRNFFSMFPRIFFYGLLYVLLSVFKVSFIAAAISMLFIVAVSYIGLLYSRSNMKV